MTQSELGAEIDAGAFASAITDALATGGRLASLFAVPDSHGCRLIAAVAHDQQLVTVEVRIEGDALAYQAVTPHVPAADWYERELRDLFGLQPSGHPDPEPLVLPRGQGVPPPRPGSGATVPSFVPDPTPLPPLVRGEGMFTIPYGPVRSGVFEAIEYVVETPGEDIPRLRTRVYYKHRGVEHAFVGRDFGDGVLVAERIEGVAAVAHAIAYCEAVERLDGAEIPTRSAHLRLLHAELERIANHLDSCLRHAEAAGQAVALARLGVHKERVLRMRAELCGNRFGRGVVVPGGVNGAPLARPGSLVSAIDAMSRGIKDDLDRLMMTPSFLDRLRGTGVIPPDVAASHAALGPLGRASGCSEDVRRSRPYGAYRDLAPVVAVRSEGDALARQLVRCEEIRASFDLIGSALERLESEGEAGSWSLQLEHHDGEAFGWAEAPQGEVLYYVAAEKGRLSRVKPRSASFHNLGLFTAAFPKDITTDFAFIEASFGLSIAGVAG
jgi:Ni,Fe-hydrogenase III large subunit